MSDERLKPCPFCGGEAKVAHEYNDEYKLAYVMCFSCGCSTASAVHEDVVIDVWNTRKPMERIVERLEAEIESSDKYIREYDGSVTQLAYNKGMRKCLEIVKGGGVDETD